MSAISRVGSSEHAEGTSAARLEESIARREKTRKAQKDEARFAEAKNTANESAALREELNEMMRDASESSEEERNSLKVDVEA